MANDLYSANFNQVAIDLMPPDKRQPKNKGTLQAVFTAVQWARDLLFGSYKTGATALPYSTGTYNLYDQVIFKKGVYESLIPNNTTSPSNTTNWRLIQANFLGVDERVLFSAQKAILEYALNQRFGGQFRMPPATSHSDIWIQTLPAIAIGFLIGNSKGSFIGNSKSSDSIGQGATFRQLTNFQINFLSALYTQTSESEVRDFVNLYNNLGLTYIIVPY